MESWRTTGAESRMGNGVSPEDIDLFLAAARDVKGRSLLGKV